MAKLRRSARNVKEPEPENIESQALKRRSRRALTDVSNNRDTKAKSKSSRAVTKAQAAPNIETDVGKIRHIESNSRIALSSASETEKAVDQSRQNRARSRSDTLDSEKQPDQTRKKSVPARITRSRTKHHGDPKAAAEPETSKRARNDTDDSLPRTKVARVCDSTITEVDGKPENDPLTKTKSNGDDQETKQTQKSAPPKPCSDILPQTDYGLVRLPFDPAKYTPGIAPYDKGNRGDALMVSDYVTDIFQRLYNAESHTHPSPYMQNQTSLSSTMRCILVDWLVEVHMKFHLVPETLYLCINIIDRYLSLVKVDRGRLQLVGVTALLLACKYEEIYPPEVRDCVYITDRAYTRQDVLDMEKDIVQALKFRMTVPTGYVFLQRYLFILETPKMMKIAANYYMERLLQEYSMIKYRPSLVAAAVVTLALNHPEIRSFEIQNGSNWSMEGPGVPDVLTKYTGFSEKEILEVAVKSASKVAEEVVTLSRRQLVAVKKKYETSRFLHFSGEFDPPDVDHILTFNS